MKSKFVEQLKQMDEVSVVRTVSAKSAEIATILYGLELEMELLSKSIRSQREVVGVVSKFFADILEIISHGQNEQ